MIDKHLRKYGSSPYNIAVVHGGPGAGGEMTPMGRELGLIHGLLEPIQTEKSVKGQVEELKVVLKYNADLPVILIGHSWGAWLCYLLAAEYPTLVKKLILISSGPFEERFVEKIEKTRLSKLNATEQDELNSLFKILDDSSEDEKTTAFKSFGELFSKADSYDHLPDDSYAVDFNPEIFNAVWPEAAKLRRKGKLLKLGHKIKCPVVAIHGDHDPHPAEGVEKPLSQILDNFRFILLEKCGHYPWRERHAKDKFYEVLKKEL
jgi:pimeloyl-ACP methyl ester carboxylesterase